MALISQSEAQFLIQLQNLRTYMLGALLSIRLEKTKELIMTTAKEFLTVEFSDKSNILTTCFLDFFKEPSQTSPTKDLTDMII